MTNEQIIMNYRNRANPPKTQIKILRQLTGKTTGQIVKILQRAGESVSVKNPPPTPERTKKPKKELIERTQMILSLRYAGYSYPEIVEKTGLSEYIIRNYKKDARRMGIEIPENLLGRRRETNDTI